MCAYSAANRPCFLLAIPSGIVLPSARFTSLKEANTTHNDSGIILSLSESYILLHGFVPVRSGLSQSTPSIPNNTRWTSPWKVPISLGSLHLDVRGSGELSPRNVASFGKRDVDKEKMSEEVEGDLCQATAMYSSLNLPEAIDHGKKFRQDELVL